MTNVNLARSRRSSMGTTNVEKALHWAIVLRKESTIMDRLHALCGLSEVIHSFDLTNASVHDIHYLKDVKAEYYNCTVIGDRGYISSEVQLDLFETASIRLEVPYRTNHKEWKPYSPSCVISS